MTPINKILQVKLGIVWWKHFPAAKQAFRYSKTMLLKEDAREPTTAKELFMRVPNFLGWVDASREDVGGGCLPVKDALKPIIWRLEWPNILRARLVMPTYPGESLDINNMGMAGKLLACLVLERNVGTKNLCYKHISIFGNNTAAVTWTQRGAAIKSAAAECLLRVLSIQKQITIASSLIDAHVTGDMNVLGYITSCSFGYSKQWHCTNDFGFISHINSQLPLFHQCSWKGFHICFVLGIKVISEWGTKASPIGEWKQLRRIGESFGGCGMPFSNP